MHLLRLLLLIPTAHLLFLAGCAPINRTVSTERFFWPPLPDRPRIEWIKSFNSQLDIEKSASQLFWSRITGDDQPMPLKKPVETKSDTSGNKLFVSDPGFPGVLVFDSKKHELRLLDSGDSAPSIIYPLSLALDKENKLYLLERRSCNILIFDQSEHFLRAIDISKIASKPVAMSIDRKTNRIFLADGASNKIFILDLTGKLLSSFGSNGNQNGKFNLPIAIAITSKGDIVVADSFNARVQIFDGNGVFKRTFGKRGDGAGDFQLIKSVAVDSEDHIYVVDGRAHRVQIFDQTGELLLIFGDFYSLASSGGTAAPGGFSIPIGIDIDSNDRIYIVDQLNARVQVFQYLNDRYLIDHPISQQ